MFGGLGLIAGVVAIKLPETKDRPIPDSLYREFPVLYDCLNVRTDCKPLPPI